MKYLIASLFFLTLKLNAADCIISHQEMHQYVIVQKVDDRTYELMSIYNEENRRILKTKKGVSFNGTGRVPPDISMKFTGERKKVKMSNGFDKTIPVYEQCDKPVDQTTLKYVEPETITLKEETPAKPIKEKPIKKDCFESEELGTICTYQ